MNVLAECSELNAQPCICGYWDICSPESLGVRDDGNGYQLLIARTTRKANNAKYHCRHKDEPEPFTIHELLLDSATSRIKTEET